MGTGKGGRRKSLAEQIAELDDPAPKDFDPEDLDDGWGGSEDEDEAEGLGDGAAAREHYQAVSKSKLRSQEPVALGKQYSGLPVGRDALNEFMQGDEDEDDSEEDDGEEDDGEEDDGEEDDGEEDDGEEDDGEEDDDEDDDDEDDESTVERDDRAELRQLMATDQKAIAATISQAAKADAAKGRAVLQQRAAFDALLNARIKLQKGMTALAELSTEDSKREDDSDDEALKSAESAALSLWSTLEQLRLALAEAQAGNSGKEQETSSKKRKRAPACSTDSTASLWQRMEQIEADAMLRRRAVLDKWSAKTRGAAGLASNPRGSKLLGGGPADQPLSSVLDAHIAAEQSSQHRKATANDDGKDDSNGDTAASPLVYDDTDFYQTLLRQLVEQRMSSTEATASGIEDGLVRLRLHAVTGMRKDKPAKQVDRRASKGRQMRFNVHEKLQNFMAPENRASWADEARIELFASLLGRTASRELDEDEQGLKLY